MRSPELYALLEELGDNRFDGLKRFAGVVSRGRARRMRGRERLTARKIQEAYRREVSALLCLAAQAMQFADTYWAGLMHGCLRPGEQLRRLSEQDIRMEAGRLSRAERRDAAAHRSLASHLEPDAWRSSRSLLKASLALVETDSAWMLMASEHARREEWSECLKALDRAEKRPSSALHQSLAWELAGAVAIRKQRLDEALQSYLRASSIEPGRAYPVACAYLLAIIVEDRTASLGTGASVEEFADRASIDLQSAAEAFRTLRMRSIIPDRALSTRHGSFVLGPATERLAHALTS